MYRLGAGASRPPISLNFKKVGQKAAMLEEIWQQYFLRPFFFSNNSWSIGQNSPTPLPNRRCLGTSLAVADLCFCIFCFLGIQRSRPTFTTFSIEWIQWNLDVLRTNWHRYNRLSLYLLYVTFLLRLPTLYVLI